jgi:hypothetical protein
MEKLDRPGAQKALRQAQLYGYLVARHGRLYYPGGDQPLCGVQTSKDIVRAGWLRFRSGKYEITPEGLRELAEAEDDIGLSVGKELAHGRRTTEMEHRPFGALSQAARVRVLDDGDRPKMILRDPVFWGWVLLAATPILIVAGVIWFVRQ